jgi:hypothetical protein
MLEKQKFLFLAYLSADCTTEIFQQPTPGSGNTKSDDRWEFPRHHLKVFNILGEGCFGQVWRCEALDIDGKYKNWLRHVPSQLHCRKFSFSPQTML